MNKKRCPWCGKIIDKEKDKTLWKDRYTSSVPRFLHLADCSHCRHKYGQVPMLYPHLLKITVLLVLLAVLTFVLQSWILLALLFLAIGLDIFLHVKTPYSKLDDKGKSHEKNTDLDCEIEILEKYGEINRYEIYFLNNNFDAFEPFVLASPIHVYSINKKSNTALGEFLYMNEKNYDYIQKDSCELYDTEMNLIAKIKFVTEI